MALYDLPIHPSIMKWGTQLFKDTVRVFDRYQMLNNKCIAELKVLHPKQFAISNYQLREDYELKQAKLVGGKIRIETEYEVDIPALSFKTRKISINYKPQIEPYLDKVLLSAMQRAWKYSAHRPQLQKQLDKILVTFEKDAHK